MPCASSDIRLLVDDWAAWFIDKSTFVVFRLRGVGVHFSVQLILAYFIVLQMSFSETTSGFILVVTM